VIITVLIIWQPNQGHSLAMLSPTLTFQLDLNPYFVHLIRYFLEQKNPANHFETAQNNKILFDKYYINFYQAKKKLRVFIKSHCFHLNFTLPTQRWSH